MQALWFNTELYEEERQIGTGPEEEEEEEKEATKDGTMVKARKGILSTRDCNSSNIDSGRKSEYQ